MTKYNYCNVGDFCNDFQWLLLLASLQVGVAGLQILALIIGYIMQCILSPKNKINPQKEDSSKDIDKSQQDTEIVDYGTEKNEKDSEEQYQTNELSDGSTDRKSSLISIEKNELLELFNTNDIIDEESQSQKRFLKQTTFVF